MSESIPPDARADPRPGRPADGPDRRASRAFWDEPARGRRPRRPSADGPVDRLRQAFGTWRGDARLGLALLVVVAVVAGVVWYRVGAGGADDPPPRALTATTDVPRGAGTRPPRAGGPPTTGGRRIVVHVAGAVTTPGVVELAPGARVIDAVEAAGGAVADADLDRLNLAAELRDGQRVLVQRVGDPPAPADPTSPGGADPAGVPSTEQGLVDLNTATAVELEALPGIGPVLAAAIIAEREERGGFRSVQELRDVRGIGDQRFADLVDLVTV